LYVLAAASKGGFVARQAQRTNCFPKYESLGIRVKFVIGIPGLDNDDHTKHIQGNQPPHSEKKMAAEILTESRLHGDMIITPNRDKYQDLNEKVLSLLRHGVASGAKYIMKVDDEYCVNFDVAFKHLDEHTAKHDGNELYLGNYHWRGNEYPSMKGADGTILPYMSGWTWALSKKLAYTVAVKNWQHNLLWMAYGTSSDDANLGKWVQHAMKRDHLEVTYVADGGLPVKF
jgi:hypothetical protein